MHNIEMILNNLNIQKYTKKKDINYDYDIVGKKFNNLYVICDTGYRDNRRKPILLCLCDCGNYTLQTKDSLTRKDGKETKSCGCLKKSKYEYPRIMTIFRGMVDRTTNQNHISYKEYGGRGITICEEWLKNPDLFYRWAVDNGYKDNYSIDRINNNIGYNKENCRWVDKKQQANNRRNTLRIEGVPLVEFEKAMGIEHLHNKIVSRLHKKWDYINVFREYFLQKFNLEYFYISDDEIKINDHSFLLEEYCRKYSISKIALMTRVKRNKNNKDIIAEYILYNSNDMCVEVIESVLQNVSRVE